MRRVRMRGCAVSAESMTAPSATFIAVSSSAETTAETASLLETTTTSERLEGGVAGLSLGGGFDRAVVAAATPVTLPALVRRGAAARAAACGLV